MIRIKNTDNHYYNIARRNVRKYRLKANLTQQALADLSELSMHFISEIESSTKEKTFSIATIGRIADVLNIPLSKFFEED